MKYIIIFLVLVSGGIALAAGNQEGQPSNDTLQAEQSSLQQIQQQLASGEARLLDVRSQVEFDLEHAAQAELFNVEWLKAGLRPEISTDEIVYVYCRSGNRSAQAADILRGEGYTVYDLGAFSNWVNAGGETETTQLPPAQDMLDALGASPLPLRGDSNAPVTMVKYADFMCPFCAKYSQETEPQIFEQYVETGKLKYEFRNLAYLGDESALAASAGYCANEQDGFWQFHDAVIDEYSLNGESAYEAEAMANTAAQNGMERGAFLSCLNSGKYDQVVSSETIATQEQGINSTPLFFINDERINGALPLSVFTATIDAQL